MSRSRASTCHTLTRTGALVGRPDHAACFGRATAPRRPRASAARARDRARARPRVHDLPRRGRAARAVRHARSRSRFRPTSRPTSRSRSATSSTGRRVHAVPCHREGGAPHRRCASCHDGARTAGHGPPMTACEGCHTAGRRSPDPAVARGAAQHRDRDVLARPATRRAVVAAARARPATRRSARPTTPAAAADRDGVRHQRLPRRQGRVPDHRGVHALPHRWRPRQVRGRATDRAVLAPPRRARGRDRAPAAIRSSRVARSWSRAMRRAWRATPTDFERRTPTDVRRVPQRRPSRGVSSSPIACPPTAPSSARRSITPSIPAPARTCHTLTTTSAQLRPPRGHRACTGTACHAIGRWPGARARQLRRLSSPRPRRPARGRAHRGGVVRARHLRSRSATRRGPDGTAARVQRLPPRRQRGVGDLARGAAEGDLRAVPRRPRRVQAHRHDVHAVSPGSVAMTAPAMPRGQRAYVIAMCAIIGGVFAYAACDWGRWPRLTYHPLSGELTLAPGSPDRDRLPRHRRVGPRRCDLRRRGRGAAVPGGPAHLARPRPPPVRRVGDHRDPARRQLLHVELVAVVSVRL